MFALVKLNVKVKDIEGNETTQDIIKLFAPHSIWEDKDGIQHSPDTLLSLTTEQKQDAGIYDVAYQTRPDDRFYNVVENAPVFDAEQKIVKVSFTSTPKQLEDEGSGNEIVLGLKTQWVNYVKYTANSILSSTDWMLIRKVERNVDIPEAIAAFRSSTVAEANRLETAISTVTNVEELISVVESANWPTAE